jgi:hypothetical protein
MESPVIGIAFVLGFGGGFGDSIPQGNIQNEVRIGD